MKPLATPFGRNENGTSDLSYCICYLESLAFHEEEHVENLSHKSRLRKRWELVMDALDLLNQADQT